MMNIPSISYKKAINIFHRMGFIVVHQKGSHIRLQKRIEVYPSDSKNEKRVSVIELHRI